MPLLQTCNLTAFYGDFQALYGIDASLDAGETIAIIGANGAGKSTFLKAIAGLIPGPADSVLLDGKPIGSRTAADIVKLGVALVPEGRRVFPSLTVEENLLIGGYGRKMRRKPSQSVATARGLLARASPPLQRRFRHVHQGDSRSSPIRVNG